MMISLSNLSYMVFKDSGIIPSAIFYNMSSGLAHSMYAGSPVAISSTANPKSWKSLAILWLLS